MSKVFFHIFEGLVSKCLPLDEVLDKEVNVTITAKIQNSGNITACNIFKVVVKTEKGLFDLVPILHWSVLRDLSDFMLKNYRSSERENEDKSYDNWRDAQ